MWLSGMTTRIPDDTGATRQNPDLPVPEPKIAGKSLVSEVMANVNRVRSYRQ